MSSNKACQIYWNEGSQANCQHLLINSISSSAEPISPDYQKNLFRNIALSSYLCKEKILNEIRAIPSANCTYIYVQYKIWQRLDKIKHLTTFFCKSLRLPWAFSFLLFFSWPHQNWLIYHSDLPHQTSQNQGLCSTLLSELKKCSQIFDFFPDF